MIRVTTTGMLKSYRSNLSTSFQNLNNAQNTVLTQRYFNSYAEDPSGATQAFKLRRSWHRLDAQATTCESITRKFNTASTALKSVESMLDTSASNSALSAVIAGGNTPTGAGRIALGTQLQQLSESIVQTMNGKYGNQHVFSGTDGLNLPLSWTASGDLEYLGVDVTNGSPTTLAALAGQSNYQDIGLGMQEDASGNLITSSAFNSALSAITYLGYGKDADGDPKNLACIVKQLGDILSRCDAQSGDWGSATDETDYTRLMGKLQDASSELKSNYVQMDTKAAFLRQNQEQLVDSAAIINEQFLEIEQCDLADAIKAFSWAQFCYNAALKIGNSILPDSLIDYMR